MFKWSGAGLALGLLGACAVTPSTTPSMTAPSVAVSETAKVVAPKAPSNARTAAQFDTVSQADRAAAKAVAPAQGETRLGSAIASLGAPAQTGLWVQTPLVSAATQGRVTAAGGKSVAVELRPAPSGSATQISLSALRLLDLPLTAMPELTIYR